MRRRPFNSKHPPPLLPLALLCFTAAILALPVPVLALLPVPTDCVVDDGGANDAPSQSDVTTLCGNTGNGTPFELNVSLNFDTVTLPGNNTTSFCLPFDTDDDGLANLTACAVVDGHGRTLFLNHVALYTCSNGRPDRCTNPQLVPGPYTTTCEVTQEDTDPFPPPPPGPGDDYPEDTRVLCGIDLADFGPAGTFSVPLDACVYPAENPNTKPGDCAVFSECTVAADCDDQNVCTADFCGGGGFCTHLPDPGPCSDGQFCNGDETCTVLGFCGVGSGTPVNCADGVGCTLDVCDELTDTCASYPANSLCSDGLFCDGVETCDALADCQPGTPVSCNDGIVCTFDSCDEAANTCDHLPSDAVCDDGAFCDGAETCSAFLGCLPGTPPACADAIDCTTDSCNEITDLCDHVANDAVCSDTLFCDGAETCDPLLGCQAGVPPNCTDAVGCTTDGCDELTNSCDHLPDNGACSDGAFCTGVEICDPVTDCGPGTDPCPGAVCDEGLDQCTGCLVDADCDNSVFCDGAEVCTAGVCGAGVPPDCNDGVGCTSDLCSESANACLNIASDPACDDSLFCNGSETCNAVTGCVAGTPPNCSDAIACTIDGCVEASDNCAHLPDDALCDNGQFCDGSERCNALSGCVSGSPLPCIDAFVCTVDSCNEATDSCEHDFSTCGCGDSEITVNESCDPPVPAGTFEDCNDDIDNDGDGLIDCLDPDCVGLRPGICDETCEIDGPCAAFSRDPATITYKVGGIPDQMRIHARMPLSGAPLTPIEDALTLELSNELGPIYRASLIPGDLHPNIDGTFYRFIDRLAPQLGLASTRDGLGNVWVRVRRDGGVPYLAFKIRAYADFSAADRSLMTCEFTLGNEVGFATANWTARKKGWLLFQRDLQ